MTTPDRHDCAVAFCCDKNYFPFALFMIWQIAHHNPHRRFDFVVASRDDLQVPDWARHYGIVLHKTGAFPSSLQVASYRGSVAPLFRLLLAREIGDRYRRILYLDCDMFVEGGDLNRLLEVDLGPHPIGAVLDAPFLYELHYRAREYALLGWPAAPYANTGLQVIDTRAYVEQEVERRSFDVIRNQAKAIIYTDQSLTNIALHGKFAQLAPCWNWQWNWRFPLATIRYPVYLRHFIGPMKPDRDATGLMDMRYKLAYRDFLQSFMPEHLPTVVDVKDTAPLDWRQMAKIMLRHVSARGQMTAELARFPDPYVTRY